MPNKGILQQNNGMLQQNNGMLQQNKGILQQNNHTCIFSPDHGLLESATKMVVHAILVVWQKNWCYKLGMSFLFPTPPSELATFLIA